jgi:hypothetical protein
MNVCAARRFAPPRSVEEQAACFVVRDHNGNLPTLFPGHPQ